MGTNKKINNKRMKPFAFGYGSYVYKEIAVLRYWMVKPDKLVLSIIFIM